MYHSALPWRENNVDARWYGRASSTICHQLSNPKLRQLSDLASNPDFLAKRKRPTNLQSVSLFLLAERTGFEPAITLLPYTLSKRAPSTTRPPLRTAFILAEPRRVRPNPRRKAPDLSCEHDSSSYLLAVRYECNIVLSTTSMSKICKNVM